MKNYDQITKDFIENRDTIKKAIRLRSTYIYPVAANVFCAAGVKADKDRLKECSRMIKKNAGFASYLKSYVLTPFAAKLCVSEDPAALCERVTDMYAILKKHFHRSDYLAMLATLLAERTTEENAVQTAERGRAIYDLMKKEHPLLTSSEDSIMAGFMAFSDKSNEELMEDAEKCYDLLRKEFSDKNTVQSVSHILAMTGGTPEEKVSRLVRIFGMLKDAGRRYGKHYELPTLAAVSLIDADEKELVDTILGIDSLLAVEKGYGALTLDKKKRLMHAAMLTADLYEETDKTEAAVSASAIALIAAQEAAMCAAIAASTAAASSASN